MGNAGLEQGEDAKRRFCPTSTHFLANASPLPAQMSRLALFKIKLRKRRSACSDSIFRQRSAKFRCVHSRATSRTRPSRSPLSGPVKYPSGAFARTYVTSLTEDMAEKRSLQPDFDAMLSLLLSLK